EKIDDPLQHLFVQESHLPRGSPVLYFAKYFSLLNNVTQRTPSCNGIFSVPPKMFDGEGRIEGANRSAQRYGHKADGGDAPRHGGGGGGGRRLRGGSHGQPAGGASGGNPGQGGRPVRHQRHPGQPDRSALSCRFRG